MTEGEESDFTPSSASLFSFQRDAAVVGSASTAHPSANKSQRRARLDSSDVDIDNYGSDADEKAAQHDTKTYYPSYDMSNSHFNAYLTDYNRAQRNVAVS